jgi:hypothetical protein
MPHPLQATYREIIRQVDETYQYQSVRMTIPKLHRSKDRTAIMFAYDLAGDLAADLAAASCYSHSKWRA